MTVKLFLSCHCSCDNVYVHFHLIPTFDIGFISRTLQLVEFKIPPIRVKDESR